MVVLSVEDGVAGGESREAEEGGQCVGSKARDGGMFSVDIFCSVSFCSICN